MALRIGIGGLWHETNTFVAGTTTLEDFRSYAFLAGAREVREAFAGTATEIGGALEACEAVGIEAVPLAYAGALPGPIVEARAREALWDLVLGSLERALPLDGLLLALHGGMVAEDLEDPESDLLVRVRRVVGSIPVAVVLDLHANPGDGLIEASDLVLAYATYPHVDAADRAAEAIGLLVESLEGTLAPLVAGRRLPLLTCPLVQATASGPLAELLAAARRLQARPGVATVSLLPGFPYADVERLGFSVVVSGEDEAANAAADEMAAEVWRRRGAFEPELVDLDQAVELALRAPGTTVLADVADNVGGGAPGRDTRIASALVEAGAAGAVVVLHDPEAASVASAAREGAHVEVIAGEPPLPLRGRVRFAGEGRYCRTGETMTGTEVAMGPCAVVEVGGVDVVLTGRRVMPFDGDHLRAVGVDPAAYRVIAVKSALAWRAGLADVAARALAVDLGGPTTCRLRELPYAHVRRPVVPLDPFPVDRI